MAVAEQVPPAVRPGPNGAPPSELASPDTELALIGSLFDPSPQYRKQNERAYTTLSGPAAFTDHRLQHVFQALAALKERGDPPDIFALQEELRRAGHLDDVGGLEYLAELADTGTGGTAETHARILEEHLHRRQLWRAGGLIQHLSEDTERPVAEVLDDARAVLEERRAGVQLAFLTEREVDEIPDAVALVGDRRRVVIPDRSLVMVEGESGAWKSFTVIDVGQAIQHGVDSALGPIGRQGQVVMIAGEGAPGLKQRFAAWRSFRGGLRYGGFLVLKDPPKLNRPEGASRVLSALSSLQDPPAMVIVDTVNTSIEGSENEREEAGAFLDFGRAVRDKFGATFVYLHHLNAEGRKARGHTSFSDDADCVIRMTREEDNRARVECRKMKDAPEFDPIALEIVPHADSLVVRRSEPSGPVIDRRDAPEYIRATLRQLSKSVPDGEGLATSKWEGICREELDLSSSTFYRHRTMLIRGDFVRQEEVAGGVRNHLTTRGEEWLS